MKLIIAGSRSINLEPEFIGLMLHYYKINPTEIISGVADGVDKSGIAFWNFIVKNIDLSLTLKKFPADWNQHGKAAGPIRNKTMAEYADALLLIWDGQSKGSANMKQNMIKLNKPIYEVILK